MSGTGEEQAVRNSQPSGFQHSNSIHLGGRWQAHWAEIQSAVDHRQPQAVRRRSDRLLLAAH